MNGSREYWQSLWQSLWARPLQRWNEDQRKAQAAYGRQWISIEFLLFVYVVHFSAMGAFGLYVFSNIATFDVDAGGCAPSTLFYFLGYAVPVTTSAFRRFWLVAYALAALPLLNKFLCGFLASGLGALLGSSLLVTGSFLYMIGLVVYEGMKPKRDRTPLTKPRLPRRVGSRSAFSLGIAGAVLLDALLIQSTERMISGNNTSPGENEWGFGQTLAVLLTVPPAGAIVLDALQFWRERKEDRRRKRVMQWGFAEGEDVLDELFVADRHRID